MALGARHLLVDVDLSVDPGQCIGLVGPNGVGKSTFLRVVAGLLVPDAGEVWLDGVDLTRVAAHRRRIGLMFQDEQLFPHFDVAANIGFGLRMERRPRSEVSERVRELLALVGLDGFGDRAVGTLSGGEAKRVALARSLAPHPAVLLLDEPLTGLDRALHDRLVADLAELLRATDTTAVLVTHDHDEAAAIAHRVVTWQADPS